MSGMCAISSQDIFRHARGQTGRIKFLSIAKKLLAGKTLQCSGIYPSGINRDYDDVCFICFVGLVCHCMFVSDLEDTIFVPFQLLLK